MFDQIVKTALEWKPEYFRSPASTRCTDNGSRERRIVRMAEALYSAGETAEILSERYDKVKDVYTKNGFNLRGVWRE